MRMGIISCASGLSLKRELFRVDNLVEETDDLAGDVLPPGLLVVHDTSRGGEDDVAELTRGQELDNPLLEVTELDVVARADDAGLVEAARFCQFGIRKRKL